MQVPAKPEPGRPVVPQLRLPSSWVLQVDPRLTHELQQLLLDGMIAGTKSRVTDPAAASAVLADMYDAVVHQGLLAA